MSGITYVPLSNELLVRLIGRYKDQFGGYVEHAVESFLERTSDDYNDQFLSDADRSYVWDQLVLPDGTTLRTNYKGDWKTTTLKSMKFVFKGVPHSSPAKVCNAMRGDTSNNAWTMLEIKRPQDVAFRVADRFRR